MNSTSQRGKSMPDIVAEAFTLCVRHWRLVFALTVAPALLTGLVGFARTSGLSAIGVTAVNSSKLGVGDTLKVVGLLLGTLWLTLIFHLAAQILLYPPIAETSLGRKPRRDRRYPGLRVKLVRAVAVAAILTVILGVLTITFVGIPVAAYLLVRWSFSGQCLAAADAPPLAAMRRSWAAVQGAWWRVALITLAIAVLALVPTFVLLPIGQAVNNEGVRAVLDLIAALLTVPFVAVATILLYLDVLSRKGERPEPAPSPE